MERHETIQPLLTDYILGESTAGDRQRVDAHVKTCAACAAELRELTLAFQSIGLQDDPIAPPPHLRARVLDRIAQQKTLAFEPPARPRRTLAPVWLAAAAVVMAVLGSLFALQLRRADRLDEALRLANGDARRLAQQIATTEAQADLAVAILTAGDMRRIDLAGLEAARASTARAYWSASHGLLIVADRLPPPPQGRIYQVWLIASDTPAPMSAGLIEAPRSGRGMLIVPTIPGASTGAVTIAVTDEPPGGVAAPTGNKHFIGS